MEKYPVQMWKYKQGESARRNEELNIYLSDLISCQHNDISPFMKALGGSQVTNALGKGKEENKVCF